MDEEEERYKEELNEIYGEVEICGYKYPAGDVLKEVDPVAFRVGLADWTSEQEEEEDEE